MVKERTVAIGAYGLMVWAWLVMIIGVATRLTDAGLGCPDWPGCYGQWLVPQNTHWLPDGIAVRKAWTEMIHRYVAGGLGLGVLWLCIGGWCHARGWWLRLGMVSLVIGQATLGMWTVTWKLHPVVVMMHLMGGMSLFSCLVWHSLATQSRWPCVLVAPWARWILRLGVVLVVAQIMLGGWMSANYAALACVGFPRCNGLWWVSAPWSSVWLGSLPVGPNYEGGVLTSEPRMLIHMLHRVTAGLVLLYTMVSQWNVCRRYPGLRWLGWIILWLTVLQVLLGIINVTALLPLANAIAHHAVASLLLAAWLTMLYLGTNHAR